KPGFAKFVDILEQQAERLCTDLTDLGDKLRAAADVYEQQDAEAGDALETSVR
ncbi:type VII secretion target, partial [Mycolicibacterium thermoresistibile]